MLEIVVSLLVLVAARTCNPGPALSLEVGEFYAQQWTTLMGNIYLLDSDNSVASRLNIAQFDSNFNPPNLSFVTSDNLLGGSDKSGLVVSNRCYENRPHFTGTASSGYGYITFLNLDYLSAVYLGQTRLFSGVNAVTFPPYCTVLSEDQSRLYLAYQENSGSPITILVTDVTIRNDAIAMGSIDWTPPATSPTLPTKLLSLPARNYPRLALLWDGEISIIDVSNDWSPAVLEELTVAGYYDIAYNTINSVLYAAKPVSTVNGWCAQVDAYQLTTTPSSGYITLIDSFLTAPILYTQSVTRMTLTLSTSQSALYLYTYNMTSEQQQYIMIDITSTMVNLSQIIINNPNVSDKLLSIIQDNQTTAWMGAWGNDNVLNVYSFTCDSGPAPPTPPVVNCTAWTDPYVDQSIKGSVIVRVAVNPTVDLSTLNSNTWQNGFISDLARSLPGDRHDLAIVNSFCCFDIIPTLPSRLKVAVSDEADASGPSGYTQLTITIASDIDSPSELSSRFLGDLLAAMVTNGSSVLYAGNKQYSSTLFAGWSVVAIDHKSELGKAALIVSFVFFSLISATMILSAFRYWARDNPTYRLATEFGALQRTLIPMETGFDDRISEMTWVQFLKTPRAQLQHRLQHEYQADEMTRRNVLQLYDSNYNNVSEEVRGQRDELQAVWNRHIGGTL